MDNAIDLHVHSTFSDGTFTLKEIVALAKEINLLALSLTDHDCIDGNEEMAILCKNEDIAFIPGVEFSVSYSAPSGKELEIHMLGYNIKSTPALKQYLNHYRQTRDNRNKEIIRLLNNEGFSFTYDDFIEYFPTGILTRAHIARYLYDHQMIPSIEFAFKKYLGDGCCCHVERQRANARDAIQLIHEAGGLAFLAHPTLYHLDSKGIRQLIADLSVFGLDGVEGIYSTYKNDESALIKQFASEHQLLISGGSDFHGSNKPYIHLGSGRGNLHIPYSIYETIQKKTQEKQNGGN